MRTTLRKGDGFGNGGTPHLMPEVERLQKALNKAGYEAATDGLFGKDTEKVVKAFQRANGLTADGIVGPATWRALDHQLPKTHRAPDFSGIPGLETFHGDLNWVHEREGHRGKPYWPGGRSGVTLDPGFDLAHQTLNETRLHYGDVLSDAQDSAVQAVIGLRGRQAKQALEADPVLQSIRISRRKALRVMPHIAVKYWKPVTRRFRGVEESETPNAVQTVLLSLAYNRGSRNSDLEVLKAPIAAGRWLDVADLVGNMQQDHALRGIRIRRRMEADLIRHETDFA
jgi:GH24 family phage-related lysozyme (muramidase)